MTIDPKALEAAARAYCTAIGLDYDRISPPLALKRDEATRAAILAYQTAFAEGWNIKSIRDGFPSAIEWIKTFRNRTNCTLKDAKEAYERGLSMPPLAMGWQDISTAPKDTPVFLWGYLEVSSRSRPLVGADDRYEAFWDDEAEAWRCYTYEGWIVSPSAWMQLPPPFKGSGSRLADATQNQAQKEQG